MTGSVTVRLLWKTSNGRNSNGQCSGLVQTVVDLQLSEDHVFCLKIVITKVCWGLCDKTNSSLHSINLSWLGNAMHLTKAFDWIATTMGECWQQEHTQYPPSMKMECDYLNGWIKKQSHTQKSHPNFWTPEIHLGNAEESWRRKLLLSMYISCVFWFVCLFGS